MYLLISLFPYLFTYFASPWNNVTIKKKTLKLPLKASLDIDVLTVNNVICFNCKYCNLTKKSHLMDLLNKP